MPPKKIKKPKQKPKQKQKQKQVVKQNVKVTVQSSGGSGGGGGGTPSYLPQQYTDTRQIGLLDEIARSVIKAPVVAPVVAPVPVAPVPVAPVPVAPVPVAPVPVAPVRNKEKKSSRSRTSSPLPPDEFSLNPENDYSTFNAVFNAPINTNKPVELGNENPITKKKNPRNPFQSENERPITKKKNPINPFESENEAGYLRSEAGYESVASAFEQPQNLGYDFPSTAFAKTPYGKIVPRFGESVEPSLASVAMGGGQKEEPVFSGFSVYGAGSRM
jgi:hypothetical protein